MSTNFYGGVFKITVVRDVGDSSARKEDKVVHGLCIALRYFVQLRCNQRWGDTDSRGRMASVDDMTLGAGQLYY